MKRGITMLASLALALALLTTQTALADYISFSGSTAARERVSVFAPIGGKVESVAVAAGTHVNAGDVLATLATTKVYATQGGVVTGVFGQAGDAVETVAGIYGAVMYIEPEYKYTIDASTDNAYSSEDTKYVHVGEIVYLTGYSDSSHTGEGIITAINGTNYTVQVRSGEFLVGETVNVFRDEARKSASRIGRGTLSRANPVAVTGSGSIVSYAVADGASVKRGDLLFETLDGSFDGLYMSGCEIVSAVSGVVAEVQASVGANLGDGGQVATIYPDGGMWIEASVAETDLMYISEGDPVSIEFTWNEDEEIAFAGEVEMISSVASAQGSEGVAYAVYIRFTPDASTRYGMSAVITTLEGDQAQAAAEHKGMGDQAEATEAAQATEGDADGHNDG